MAYGHEHPRKTVDLGDFVLVYFDRATVQGIGFSFDQFASRPRDDSTLPRHRLFLGIRNAVGEAVFCLELECLEPGSAFLLGLKGKNHPSRNQNAGIPRMIGFDVNRCGRCEAGS